MAKNKKYDTNTEAWKGFGQSVLGLVACYFGMNAVIDGVSRSANAQTINGLVENSRRGKATTVYLNGQEHNLIDVGAIPSEGIRVKCTAIEPEESNED